MDRTSAPARFLPAGLSASARWAGLRRRVVGDRELSGSSSSALDGAPRWVSGALAGVQAAVLSLLVVVLPAVAAFVATSADPVNAGAGWGQAVGVGVGLWLLGHGMPLVVAGAEVSVVPLGITALALFACYASARRSARPTWSSWAAGMGAYVVVVLLVLLAARSEGTSVWRVLGLGATVLVLAGLGLGAGMLRRPESPGLARATEPLWRRVPGLARIGAVGGLVAVVLTVGVAALVTLGWLIGGREQSLALLSGLRGDAVSDVAMVLGQAVVLPDVVVWALAWVAGPGFAVGAETLYAPSGLVPGDLPWIPVLGLLPATAGGVLAWSPVLVVLAGAAGGWAVHRRRPAVRWWEPLATVSAGAVVAGLVAATLVAAASGGIGPGRMAHVGASASATGLVVGLEVALGMALVTVLAGTPVRGAARRRSAAAWDRVRTRRGS